MKSRSAHHLANLLTVVIVAVGLLGTVVVVLSLRRGTDPLEAVKRTVVADRIVLSEPRATVGFTYSGDRLLVVTGWVENIGRNPVTDARIVVELLDDLGKVCQSGPLKIEQGALRAFTSARDVVVFQPGSRTAVEWVRSLDDVSSSWGGRTIVDEALQIGTHNNNTHFHAMMAGLGIKPDRPSDLITQEGVMIDNWVRIRVKD